MKPLAVGVLASGSGTNLQALLDAVAAGAIRARIAVVISDVPGARALERAEQAGVPAVAVPRKGFPDKAAFEAAIAAALDQAGCELVVLAGFMRLLSCDFVKRWEGKLVNVHPALLPSFPGLHAAKQALDHGAKLAGCTVHLVDEGTDTGPVIAQAAVPVLDGDDEASLHARIQLEERRLLPWVVGLFADGRVSVEGRRVVVAPPPGGFRVPGTLAWPEPR